MELLYRKKDRHATWLELFFDLVFVVLIGKITHLLGSSVYIEKNLISELVKYIIVFLPIWWLWTNLTVYLNIFDKESKSQRFLILVIMFLMIVLSIFIDKNFINNFSVFVIFFSGIRLLIGGFYFITFRELECDYKYSEKMGKIIIFSTLIGAVSIFLKNYTIIEYLIFYFSLFLEFLLERVWARKNIQIKVHRAHIVERSGLLVIILLGEIVFSIANSIKIDSMNFKNFFLIFISFSILGSIWWIYFESFHKLENSDKLKNPQTIMVPHFIFCLGLSLIASNIKYGIAYKIPSINFKWLIIISLFLFYLGKDMPYYILYKEKRRKILINFIPFFIIIGIFLFFKTTEVILLGNLFGFLIYILADKKIF